MRTRKPLALFWKALDEILEANTDRREWLLRLGADWRVASAYLTATGLLAKEISCPAPGADGCPRKVVKHADGSFRAVCGNKPAECDAVDLSREEVTCLTLDRTKLANSVGAILNVEREPGAASNRVAMVVGSHGVAAGVGIPVVLMIPGPIEVTSAETISELSAGGGPLVIAVPTLRSIPRTFKAALTAQGHEIIALAEVTTVKDARLVGVSPAEVLLTAPRDKLLRNQTRLISRRAWLMPADARWEELAFEFTADQVVNVRFRGETRRFEPEHFQMKDRRSGKPTEQWALLKIFAAYEGKIGWSATAAKVTIKKQKQELGKKLRIAFAIKSKPIFWNRRAGVYQTRFVIRGDILDRNPRRSRG